jgi:hypothetical protein
LFEGKKGKKSNSCDVDAGQRGRIRKEEKIRRPQDNGIPLKFVGGEGEKWGLLFFVSSSLSTFSFFLLSFSFSSSDKRWRNLIRRKKGKKKKRMNNKFVGEK